MKNIKIKDVMTACPFTIGANQPVKVALEALRKHNIRHLPVKEGGQVVGILSDRDIDHALALEKKDASEMSVSEVYFPDPYCVTPEDNLADVVLKMAENGYGSVLVMNGEALAGIITTMDVCRVLNRVLKGQI
jgi:acetoin utilization protein AcuB